MLTFVFWSVFLFDITVQRKTTPLWYPLNALLQIQNVYASLYIWTDVILWAKQTVQVAHEATDALPAEPTICNTWHLVNIEAELMNVLRLKSHYVHIQHGWFSCQYSGQLKSLHSSLCSAWSVTPAWKDTFIHKTTQICQAHVCMCVVWQDKLKYLQPFPWYSLLSYISLWRHIDNADSFNPAAFYGESVTRG